MAKDAAASEQGSDVAIHTYEQRKSCVFDYPASLNQAVEAAWALGTKVLAVCGTSIYQCGEHTFACGEARAPGRTRFPDALLPAPLNRGAACHCVVLLIGRSAVTRFSPPMYPVLLTCGTGSPLCNFAVTCGTACDPRAM